MTNQEILTKAIEEALAGGWHGDKDYYFAGNRIYFSLGEITEQAFSYSDLIFNHGFAKALWGEEKLKFEYDEDTWSYLLGGLVYYPYTEGANIIFKIPAWKYHIQMMLLASNPIKYLGENI